MLTSTLDHSGGATILGYHKIILGQDVLAAEVQKDAAFGYAVAALPDLNSNSYAELVVGAPFKDFTGVVYVLFLTYGRYVVLSVCTALYDLARPEEASQDSVPSPS